EQMHAEISPEEQADENIYFCEKQAVRAVFGGDYYRRDSQTKGKQEIRRVDVVAVVREQMVGEQGRQPLGVDANPDPNPVEVGVAHEATAMEDVVRVSSEFARLRQVRSHLDACACAIFGMVLMDLELRRREG